VYNLPLGDIKARFGNWLYLLRGYPLSYSEDEYFLREYENEYFQTFEFAGEDERARPFDHKAQLLLYYCLEGIENALKQADPGDPEIKLLLAEAESLKGNIQNLSRVAAARKTSRLWAKIKKKGLALALGAVEEMKKELYKRAVNWVFDGIGHLITNHHLLP
jgi:hypothetical protein